MANVQVYSTPTCPYCHMVKKFLKDHSVDFQDYDVSADAQKAQEMKDKSNVLSVPVIDVDGKIIVGFDEAALKEVLGIKD